MRIYHEVTFFDLLLVDVTVPVGASFFPKELGQLPRALVLSLSSLLCYRGVKFETLCRFFRARSNVVFESEHDSGGHFAAYEKPEVLVGDLRKMFGKGGPAAGVVPGHNGF